MSAHASVRHFVVYHLCQTTMPGWVHTWNAGAVVTNILRGEGGGRGMEGSTQCSTTALVFTIISLHWVQWFVCCDMCSVCSRGYFIKVDL